MVKKTLIGLMAASAASLTFTAGAHADFTDWSLTSEVEPGGLLSAFVASEVGRGCAPVGPVTSPGFAAPMQWVDVGNPSKHLGYTHAIERPGKYSASFPCTDGRTATRTFTILGTPPPTTSVEPKPPATAKPQPPTTKPKPPTSSKAPKPAKPQVGIKPAGAPQTGDGSLP
ncbi:hypothetical protein [Amycolatopsis sp. CA-126428]|uniref:hypothetical protein n=1 Tax=Amycolatopsis sp. CA-126428 TaxID=2073158 RepID=UPI000CD321E5|nr:hypothetical protein [Amycolatopsis sp. CA-126428]